MGELCPRRIESPATAARLSPKGDSWDDHGSHRTCSYCGSIHPDDLFHAIGVGGKLTPTDKDYKVYVEIPNPRAGQRVVIGRRSGPAVNGVTGEPNLDDLSIFERIMGKYDRKIYGTAPVMLTTKFYFQHLSRAERERFINLMNSKTLKLALPGHFYVLPFFAGRA